MDYVTHGEGVGRYLKLLHGNFAGLPEPERATFLADLAEAATLITDAELASLLAGGWRERITAGWLIGVDRRGQFRDRLAELLLESAVCFAGQSYCFAFACLGTSADAEVLAAYLETYLPRTDLQYDQDWAFGALQHIDAGLGSGYAARFTQGLWQSWAAKYRADAADHKNRIDLLCSLVAA
ncbi:hypothetical protein SAMN05421504_11266 [Amycolatopsis xylanica]|uniref:Uncharacterized protein n=1 Tax=Amycolatopsis xylanica TaxID=589385 RepID=A0A1H3RWY6_9PSEU|nr:DUF6000 family protein [Amycolatopsis xylanica]SDZ30137.1 hypothetical protein SAMN05421504_11266 [Amycolatopsis xylanica]